MNINTKKGTVRLTKPEDAVLGKALAVCAMLSQHADKEGAEEATDCADLLIGLRARYAAQAPVKLDQPLLPAAEVDAP